MKKLSFDDAPRFRDDSVTFQLADPALPLFRPEVRGGITAGPIAAVSPTSANEVSFLNGLTPKGKITNNSYWGSNGETAYKWGDSTAGTGATITYGFQGSSNFTNNEKATFLKAFAMWSAVANVTFVEASPGSADVLIRRGSDGSAYNITPTSDGSGKVLGAITGQALISIDDSVDGFELTGSFNKFGGYGLSTVIHEVGHLLGLGHGGAYNGAVNPDTEQFSAFDDRMYTIMSYISWRDGDTKFSDQNPIQGTNWGITSDGIQRQAPHSIMSLDILAIQQLYGTATTTPFAGGETYGFNSNIAGSLRDFFDFTVNTSPVVTLFNKGLGNVLDASGYSANQEIDLRGGAFCDVGGLDNNVCIAAGTRIDTGIGGSGDDVLIANDFLGILFGGAGADVLRGGAGVDELHGGAGKDQLFGGASGDLFFFDAPGDTAAKAKKADVISDFSHAQGDKIDLTGIDAIAGGGDNAFTFIGTAAFGNNAGELRYSVSGGDSLVSGDINGDGTADFVIRVESVTSLVSADFNF